MATRKKKDTIAMPGTIGSATLTFPNEPTVVVGSHLTVTTYPDGRTELKWDDQALAKDVAEAIASAEFTDMKPAVKAKVAVRRKKAANEKSKQES